MIKDCNIFWGQKLANTCSFVGGRIIVQQKNFSRAERSWTNYSLGEFKVFAFILDAIRRSFFTKSATAAMFTSVRVDFGRPPLSSPSTSSLPTRNREYHLKTFDRLRTSFPISFCTNTSVSVADRPDLKQNFMATSVTYGEN
jgi:hypothetical protein